MEEDKNKNIFMKLLVLFVIFLGGAGYLYIFFYHPYMSGFPDGATFSQSTLQTLEAGNIVSENERGGTLATELFPIVFLINTAMTAVNDLFPFTNIWIMERMMNFLLIALFFFIGKNLAKNVWGGVFTAFFIGTVAVFPVFVDQTFSRYMSTYIYSFLFASGLVAILPRLLLRRNFFRSGFIFFILGGAAFLSHHHFGIFRMGSIALGIILIVFLYRKNLLRENKIYYGSFVVLSAAIVAFLLAINFRLLKEFYHLWAAPVLQNQLPDYGTTSAASSESGIFSLLKIPIQNIWNKPILFSHPLFTALLVVSIIGVVFGVVQYMKMRRENIQIASHHITFALLMGIVLTHFILLCLPLPFPARSLHDIVLFLTPFAGLLFAEIFKRMPQRVSFTLILPIMFFMSLPWFQKVFAYEKLFNTSWKDIEFFEWTSYHIPDKSRIITDPFTFQMLFTGIPYPRFVYEQDFSPEEAMALKRSIFLPDEDTKRALQLLCPEYILVDTPQTSQFYSLAKPREWYNHPDLFYVIFDSREIQKYRTLVVKNKVPCKRKSE